MYIFPPFIGNKADVKKYKLPTLERPFTSVQVHSANAKSKIIESKFYDIGSGMPGELEKRSCYDPQTLQRMNIHSLIL